MERRRSAYAFPINCLRTPYQPIRYRSYDVLGPFLQLRLELLCRRCEFGESTFGPPHQEDMSLPRACTDFLCEIRDPRLQDEPHTLVEALEPPILSRFDGLPPIGVALPTPEGSLTHADGSGCFGLACTQYP